MAIASITTLVPAYSRKKAFTKTSKCVFQLQKCWYTHTTLCSNIQTSSSIYYRKQQTITQISYLDNYHITINNHKSTILRPIIRALIHWLAISSAGELPPPSNQKENQEPSFRSLVYFLFLIWDKMYEKGYRHTFTICWSIRRFPISCLLLCGLKQRKHQRKAY